jgi:hypothetical protein
MAALILCSVLSLLPAFNALIKRAKRHSCLSLYCAVIMTSSFFRDLRFPQAFSRSQAVLRSSSPFW